MRSVLMVCAAWVLTTLPALAQAPVAVAKPSKTGPINVQSAEQSEFQPTAPEPNSGTGVLLPHEAAKCGKGPTCVAAVADENPIQLAAHEPADNDGTYVIHAAVKPGKGPSSEAVIPDETSSRPTAHEPVHGDGACPLLFCAGSTLVYGYGFGSFWSEGPDASVNGAKIGYMHCWRNHWAGALEIGGIHGDIQRGHPTDLGDTWGASIDALLRWNFLSYGRANVYSEIGFGYSNFSHSIPSGGTNGNFDDQAGVGTIIDINDRSHFIGGVRWNHMSNGSFWGRSNQNPGYDSFILYGGFAFNF